jgi:hypothetical protein
VGRHVHLSIRKAPTGPPGILHLATHRASGRSSVRARATALPYRMQSAERISIGFGLDELERSEAVALLRECRRVLEAGGRVTIVALTLESIIAVREQGGDRGRTGPPRPTDADARPPLGPGLRGTRWIASATGLGELATQVGLTIVSGGDAPPQGDHTGRVKLELTRQLLPSLSSTRPLVSVLIPAFKHQFFAEAVESVLAQTYASLELVICDDCPTDDIRTLTARYLARDSRVRYVRNPSTLGSRQNHIRCLELAEGELVKFLSDDDRLHPACLDRMVSCLVGHPDVTLVTSHRQCIDAAGRHLADLDATLRPVREDSRADGADLARAVLLLRRNMIGEPSTTMFRRQDLASATPDIFSLEGRRYDSIGDVVMWLNLLGKGDAVYLADTLSYFRLHPDQEQRGELVRTTAVDSWTRMRVDAGRLGLVPADAPIQLRWTPLAGGRPVLAELSAPGTHAVGVETEDGPRELDGGLDACPAPDQHVGGFIDVLGWVVSDLPDPVDVRVLVDGSGWPAWRARLSGPDTPPLASALPPPNPFPGFYLMLDTRTVPDGPHILTFVATCGRRTLILGERQVVVRNRELLGVADGPAGELIERLGRERDGVRRHLQGRLDTLARERDAERQAWEERLGATSREREAERRELEDRLTAITGDAIARRQELEDRLAAITGEAIARRQELEGRLAAITGEASARRQELEDRLAAITGEAIARRQELEGRLDALARERDVARLDLQRRLAAAARLRDAERLALLGRLDELARDHEARARDQERQIERLARERHEATARLGRMLRAWPVRLYARFVRLPGAAGVIRWIAGVRP